MNMNLRRHLHLCHHLHRHLHRRFRLRHCRCLAFVLISAVSLQLLALLPAASPAAATAANPAADRTADWKAVADARQVHAPKTASAALEKIIAGAIADAAHPEALRAILIKAQTDASVGNHRAQAAAQIRALSAYLTNTPPVALPASMRPLLEAALAKQWWNYYQQNRWQLLQRTQTAESPSDDFLTWDARRVLAETAAHFDAALADPAALRRTPIATLEPLLAKGALPDTYRPTLYDFLIQEAIAFHSAGDQGVAKTEDAFEPTPDSPILAPLEDFLAWNPAAPATAAPNSAVPATTATATASSAVAGTTGIPTATASTSLSPTLRAVQLYQQLLRSHLADPLPQLALADADLARLNWAAGLLGEPARDRHLAALRAFIERATADEPSVATAASLKLAQLLVTDDPAAAVATAQAALDNDRFSINPAAANECRNLIARTKAVSLQNVTTETTWAPAPTPTPQISIRYRNHTRIHFRAYPVDWKREINDPNASNLLASKNLAQLRSRIPAKTWSAPLPATPDYRYRDEKLPAPRDLAPGCYIIAASLDKNFPDNKNIITAATVWVGNLAIIHDSYNYQTGRLSGYVLNATTGDPIPNATVTAYYASNNQNLPTPPAIAATTAADGSFIIAPATPASSTSRNHNNNLIALHATAPDGQSVATTNAFYNYR
ncbi:MAG: hypothetical protein LBM04_07530, partial [Opitutaceae bacterium]|nr:hypothetical protein [Opitutaceae bacterium]